MSLTVRFDKYSQSTGKPLRQKNNPFKLTIEDTNHVQTRRFCRNQ